jgi:hypothetical protein
LREACNYLRIEITQNLIIVFVAQQLFLHFITLASVGRRRLLPLEPGAPQPLQQQAQGDSGRDIEASESNSKFIIKKSKT